MKDIIKNNILNEVLRGNTSFKILDWVNDDLENFLENFRYSHERYEITELDESSLEIPAPNFITYDITYRGQFTPLIRIVVDKSWKLQPELHVMVADTELLAYLTPKSKSTEHNTQYSNDELCTVLRDLDKSIHRLVSMADCDPSLNKLLERRYPFHIPLPHVAFDIYNWGEAILDGLGIEKFQVFGTPTDNILGDSLRTELIRAIDSIENWEGEAYQPPNKMTDFNGDDIYIALHDIKRLVGYPEKTFTYTLPTTSIWASFGAGVVVAFDEYHALTKAVKKMRNSLKVINQALDSEEYYIDMDFSQINIVEIK